MLTNFDHLDNCKDNPGVLWHLIRWLEFWQLRTWIHATLAIWLLVDLIVSNQKPPYNNSPYHTLTNNNKKQANATPVALVSGRCKYKSSTSTKYKVQVHAPVSHPPHFLFSPRLFDIWELKWMMKVELKSKTLCSQKIQMQIKFLACRQMKTPLCWGLVTIGSVTRPWCLKHSLLARKGFCHFAFCNWF